MIFGGRSGKKNSIILSQITYHSSFRHFQRESEGTERFKIYSYCVLGSTVVTSLVIAGTKRFGFSATFFIVISLLVRLLLALTAFLDLILLFLTAIKIFKLSLVSNSSVNARLKAEKNR